MQTLEAFIAAERERPFVWGETDCASTFDRWLKNVRGYSPVERFIGGYRTQQEAQEIIRRDQNFLFAMLRVAELDGGVETDDPQPGDVGIIVYGKMRACAAIRTATGWFSREEDGIIEAPADVRVIKAWKA